MALCAEKTVPIHYMILCLVFLPRIVSRKPTHATCIIWIINEHDYFDTFDTRQQKSSIFEIFQRKHEFLGSTSYTRRLTTAQADMNKIEDSDICFFFLSFDFVKHFSSDWRREWLLFFMRDMCACFRFEVCFFLPTSSATQRNRGIKHMFESHVWYASLLLNFINSLVFWCAGEWQKMNIRQSDSIQLD